MHAMVFQSHSLFMRGIGRTPPLLLIIIPTFDAPRILVLTIVFYVPDYSIANLNCSFQEQDGSPTICAWNSTEEFNPFFFLPRGEYDLLHWQPINEISPMDERDHGVNPEHFDGNLITFKHVF